jgi:hypothetical protein
MSAAAAECRAWSALIASMASAAPSSVENANRPWPVGRMLPKPVSCVTTGRPAAR